MRIAPGYPASQTFSILFEAALNRTFEELENWNWVSFMEKHFPELGENLSTAKSPQQMFGAIAKNYLAPRPDNCAPAPQARRCGFRAKNSLR